MSEEDAIGFAKTFPDIPCVSHMSGGPSLRLGIPKERLSISPGIWNVVKNASWLVTWECPLRTASASSKSLESLMQLISFCNSCILPVSSRIVSWSSTNLLLAMVSKVEPWNFPNSSISLRLFSWASRRSQFCFNNCSWRSWWSCRRRVLQLEHDEVLPAATRSFHSIFVYFFGHNQPGIRAFESPLDSQRGFAPFVGLGES